MDPTITDPDKYRAVFENERVRVLEYRDEPGEKTSAHERRLLGAGGESRDVKLERGEVRWLDAQTHSGEKSGDTPSHTFFVELKEGRKAPAGDSLGPS